MKCPRCSAQTTVMKSHDVPLDVCHTGCGGIWFDWLEIRKIDEAHEADPAFLAKLAQGPVKKVDLKDRLDCPQCTEKMPLMRRYWSVKRQLEVDECPKCGGLWLDAGELTHIYAQFKTEKERRDAAEQLFADLFQGQLALEKQKSQEKLTAARKVAHALRFICPSYYIPGKQNGGAF